MTGRLFDVDPFAADPIVAAWNLLLGPWQDYQNAGRGSDAERAAIPALRDAAWELFSACEQADHGLR